MTIRAEQNLLTTAKLREMHTVLTRHQLSENVTKLDVLAPRIAQIRRPGQFVIVRLAENSERIPLTIADADERRGSISLVIQAVGKSTNELCALQAGQSIRDIAGPLGHPTDLISSGHALCIGGGVGTAVVHPIAQGLHRRGIRVTSIIGGRSKDYLIYEWELRRYGPVLPCTDDGSYGHKGFVTDAARELFAKDKVDIVYAVGPVPMMRAVSKLTRELNVRTIVSLNPIMVDGTGMCGGCRVSIGNETKFACVDGPEFDAHQVDFDELTDRLASYREFEQQATRCAGENCRIKSGTGVPPVSPETDRTSK